MAKLDGSGNFLWGHEIVGFSAVLDLAVDSGNNLVAAGRFQGTADFDPGPGVVEASAPGDPSSGFLLRVSPAGEFDWVRTLDGNLDFAVLEDVAFNSQDNIYVSGQFRDDTDFDPGPGILELPLTGFSNGFIWKLDDGGNFLWARALEGDQHSSTLDLAVDSSDAVYATGFTSGRTDMDPGPNQFYLDEGNVIVDCIWKLGRSR